MRAYRMLALDLDGTLTNSKKQITPVTREALHRAAAQGVTIVLASGRPVMGMRATADALDLAAMGGYLVSCNGAIVVNARTNETVFQSIVPGEYAQHVYDLAHAYDLAALSYDDVGVVTERPDDQYVKLEAFNNGLPIRGVSDLGREITWPVPKYMIVGEPERLSECVHALKARFGEALNIFLSESYFCEITAPGINKAYGLKVLLERLGLAREQLMACGDGFNDIDMLSFAGFSVAMANAYPEVKAIAQAETASNDEDGVARAIERFMLRA